MSTKNQLTTAADYDVKRMIFSDPQQGSVPNTPIVYKRIAISTLYKDGTTGDLILPTEELFSFGVSENVNPETKKVNGHVFPLCLWNREGATEAEKAWTDTFERIVEHCKNHLINNRDEIEQYDLSGSDLKKFNPLYWKREKGKIVDGTGPTLYTKLIASKKKGDKILSMFFNYDNEPIDPLTLLNKYCYTRAAVKIESIFIGNKICLQIKLYEAVVRVMDGGMKPLMSRPKDAGRMLTSGKSSSSPAAKKADSSDVDEAPEKDGGSLRGSDVEDDEKPVPKPAAKPVRKVVKKVVKK